MQPCQDSLKQTDKWKQRFSSTSVVQGYLTASRTTEPTLTLLEFRRTKAPTATNKIVFTSYTEITITSTIL